MKGNHALLLGEALERSLELLDRKIPKYTGQRLIEKWEGWMKGTSWIKITNTYSPNRLKQLAGSGELPAGLGWHFFQATALPLLKYMKKRKSPNSKP